MDCAIVGRDRPTGDWELIVYTLTEEQAHKSAGEIQEQERRLGNQKFEAKVLRRADWEGGRTRAKLSEKAPCFSDKNVGAHVV